MEKDIGSGELQALEEKAGIPECNTKTKASPAFEEVLDAIGSRGKFQTRLNIVFVCFASCFDLMSVNMFYLAMQTPDHWCYVPGRELSNLSVEQWKNLTIPREGASFSKCLMYNQSDVTDFDGSREPVKCQHGWEYDDTWFSLTVTSQMNWVCDNRQAVNDVLFYSQIIGVALGLLFGYIGDMYGRRPQQLLCLSAHVVSRVLVVLAPHVLPLFILAESLVSAAAGPMIESVLSVGLELTDIKHRTAVNRYACCSMAVGMMLAGLVPWALPNWNYSLSFAALSCFILFFFFSWFPESPRWLACRGRDQEALAVVRRIAATNGSTVPPFALQVIQTVGKSKTDRRGFLGIFSSWNVFRNTAILIVARSVHLLTMYSPVIAVSRLSVNPFLGIVAQGAAKFTAYYLVNYFGARFGRRWPGVASALLAAMACVLVFYLLTAHIAGAGIVVATMLMQFSTIANMGMANLQSIEVHPTCLRQIATSVEWAVAGIAMSSLPYLALMDDKRLPFAILAALNLVVAFSVSFLPESALQRLPETLRDGAVFGRGQPYWSWKPKPTPEYTKG
ncbi:solute carrier family 22 member 7-like [Schistocerca serialis cubense]|uniref:solute carrier family 22 member 7-like n=1 Tax=Schistocerca serialis cubense TaxID=2023355 RepID=UPI00214E1533|nr:solute carrier family 22 member 7-like [Schistocerca serialis cubense]